MGKYLLSLSISFLLLVSSQQLLAQCPTVAGTTINTCDFSTGGEITIIFTDGDPSEHENYILYDTNGPTAVSEPFGSVTKSYNAGTQTLVYGNIPDGTYLAGNSGCPTLGGFGIDIDQSNELILSVNSVVDDCDNLGSGEIDLTVSGGDAPYSYAWSGGLPDQEDQTGLSAGSYDVTVTDADNCTFTLTGIVVEEGPDAGVYVGTAAEVCNDNASFDLASLLDGSQDAGGSWNDDDASGAGITGNDADFTTVAAGTYDFTYTVSGGAGCTPDTETVTVNVTESVNAGAYVGTPAEVCNDNAAYDLTNLLDGSQDAGGTWTDTDGSTATITGNDADFTTVAAGTYDFTYTVTGTGPCGNDIEVVTVNVTEAPNAGAYVGTAAEVCNDNASFDLTSLLDGSQDAGGSWNDDDASGAGITGNDADFTTVAAGTYDFTYTVSGGAGCTPDTETVTVNVTESVNAGTYVGTPAEVCNDNAAYDLTNLLDGSQDAGGTWTDTDGSTATITGNDADFTTVAAGTYDFTYTVTGTGPCGNDIEVVTVNVTEAPNAGAYVGTAAEVCNDNASFDLTSLLDGSQDAGGSWNDDDASGAGITGNDADFTAVAAGTYDFTYTVSGGAGCTPDTETVTVNVTESVNAGTYVGTPAEVCNDNAAYDLTNLLDGSQDAGGTWTDTDGSTATITGNDADFTTVAAGTYDFTYTVTGTGPCGNDIEVVTVNVTETPNAGAYVGTAAEVCNDNASFDLTSLLDGSQDAGGSWNDDDASGAGITGNDADFTTVAAGTYDFTYTVSGGAGCTPDTETVTVNVTESVNAGTYVGTPAEVCNDNAAYDLTNLLDGSQDAGGTWTDTDGSTATITGNDADFTTVAAGTYDFTYTVTGTGPCGNDIEVVTVNVTEAPNAGAYVGTAAEVCNDNASFDLTSLLDGSQDAGGSWNDDDASGAGITGNDADFTTVAAGTYDFTYTVSGGAGCTPDTETVTVNVTESVNAGTYIGTPAEVCNDNAAYDLTNLLDGSQDAGGTWTDTDGSTATITGNDADFTTVAAGTYDFTYTVTGTGPCGNDIEVVTVNVTEAPNAGAYVGTAAEVCNDNASFDLASLLDGSQDAGGSWNDDDASGAGITGNDADFTTVAAGTYDFTYTVSGGAGCTPDTETVTVNVTESVNAGAYVGTPAEVCNDNAAYDLTNLLDGSQDAGGTWTDTDGSTATITGNDADFTTVAAGTYDFTYTVTGTGPCGNDIEVVTVNVTEAPNAGAYVGTAAEVCNDNASFDLTSLLDGSQDAGGSWNDDDASGAGITGNDADFTTVAAGTYDFTYTVSGGAGCTPDTETVTVNVTESVNAGTYVGTPAEVCNDNAAYDLTNLLDGSQDAGGTWTDTDGSTATITGNDADFTTVAAGTYDFTYTVTGTGPCGNDIEVVTVNVTEAPNAGAYVGTAAEVCNDNASFDLTSLLDGSQDAGGSWNDDDASGAGITGNDADFTAVAAGTYDFTYTVSGGAGCTPDTETVTVNVTESVNAGTYVGTPAEVCNDNAAYDLTNLLDGSQDAGGTWTDTDGSTATITGNDADFTTVAAGTYDFTYTVTGTGPCGNDIEVVTVNVTEAPNAGAYVGTAAEVCNDNASFDLTSLLDGSQDAGGSWNDDDASGAGITGNDADFTTVAAGTYDFTYTVSGGAGCTPDTETVTVNVTESVNAGTYVGTPAEVCNDNAAYDLTNLLDGSQDAGGTWTDTDGSTATITGNDADFTTVAAGTYDFTYTVTGTGPCGNDIEVVTVNVTEAPNAGAYVGTAAEVCNDNASFDLTSLLDGSQDAGGSWNDDDASGAGITGNDADFTAVAAGTYDFTYTVSGGAGCTPDTETVTVNVNSLSISLDASNPTSGCGIADGSLEITANSTFIGDTFTFDWSGPSGYTNTLTNANDGDITGLEGGDYTVTVTSDNTGCTVIETYTVNDPVPFSIDVLTASPQQTCGNNDGELNVEVSGLAVEGEFYIEDLLGNEIGGTRSTLAAASPTIYNFNTLSPGDYRIFVEEGACMLDSAFTISPVDQIAAIVSSTTEPSCGNSDGVISLEVTDVGNDFDVTYDDGVNPAVTSTETAVGGVQTVDLTGLAQGNYTITITDNTTNCEIVLNQLLNENAPFSIDNVTETDIQTCGGTEGEILLDISGLSGGQTYTWTGPTGFTDPGTEDLTALDVSGDYQLTIEDVGCTVVSDVFTISEPTPPTSVAGADSTICLPNLTLYADALGTNQTGEWQIVSQPAGANATFVDATSPTSDIENLNELGAYELAWILENTITSCADSDTIVITRKDITIADAGTDQGVCVDNTTLSANTVAANETGTWTVDEGSGSFGDENDPNSTVSGLSEGVNKFVWTITDDNLICTQTTDTVTVFYDIPANPGVSQGTENLTSVNPVFDLFDNLDGSQDTDGVWSFVSGPATVNPAASTVDFTGQVSGLYEFKYKVQDSLACSADSVNVLIDYLDFQCEDAEFSELIEDATCQGVQDGKIFLYLDNVSNTDSLEVVINSVVMDTFAIKFANLGSRELVKLDTVFFSGNYEMILNDNQVGCSDTISVLVGQKQSILPLVNTSDATCDNPVGQIQVTIDGTFDFVLLDSTDTEIETNTTGLFTDLAPAKYGVAFNNSGGCQVDTVKNIIINEPTQVSNSALDVTVVEPTCTTTRAQILINFELEGDYFYEILDTAGVVVDSITTDSGEWSLELDTLGLFELNVSNVDNPGVCEPNSRNFTIERAGGFIATVTDKTDITCFGESTGTATIELDGISSGFYSLDGTIWTEFISGEPITDLPARKNILVSDQPGTSECELSVEIGIEFLSQPIEFAGNGRITLITQASCTVAEEIGEINVPEVTGGVAPYIYSIDGDVVELDGDRNITGLARNVNELTITDDTGCSETFDIRSIVSPNEIRVEVTEINPENNCIDDPEGILVTLDQATIDNVPGPYNLILNKVNDTITSEYVLNINTNGSREFTIAQFDVDNSIPFEKGARYRWTVRAIDDDQACSADNFVTINGGAIIPTFEIEASDVACFQESGSIELFNIVADETIPLNIEVYEGNDIDPTQTFTLNSIPESGRFLIDQSIYGMIDRGDYIIKLNQQPENCSSLIESDNASIFIDAPVAQLNVELVPEPNLPPGVDRERADMNPVPTSRPDRANGSISIRLVEPTTGANSYSAQIFLLTPLGGNNSSDYVLPTEPIDFGSDQVITFENLLPGVYEIEYYDSFGCGTDGNRLVFDEEGSSDITVDFDRSPFIPNVFTPNNDGKNDVFRILNLPDNGAELVVTNRNGTIVFRDSNYRSSNLWDGGDNPDGIYFYQLTVDGSVQNGWVEIISGKR